MINYLPWFVVGCCVVVILCVVMGICVVVVVLYFLIGIIDVLDNSESTVKIHKRIMINRRIIPDQLNGIFTIGHLIKPS